MKPMKTLMTILAAAAVSACALSDTEIREALDEAAATPSTLDFKVGQAWTEKTVTHEYIATMKLEKGKFEYCAMDSFMTGTACPTVDGIVTVTEDEAVHHVVGEADLAGLALPGFAVRATWTTHARLENWDPRSNTMTSTGTPAKSVATGVYALGEANGFVVSAAMGDHDESRGSALYPSHPVAGEAFSDDRGNTWRVTEATTVTIGDQKNLKAHRAVKLANLQAGPIDHAFLLKNCVLMLQVGDTEWELKSLKGPGDICRNPFLLEERTEIVVAKDLQVQLRTHRRQLRFDEALGRRDDGTAWNFYDETLGEESILFILVEEYTTTESDIISLTY